MSDPSMVDVLAELRRIRIASQAGLTFTDLAVYIGVSESTARRMARQATFPKQKAIQTDDNGSAVKRFLRADIDAWLKSAPISRASQPVQRRRLRNRS